VVHVHDDCNPAEPVVQFPEKPNKRPDQTCRTFQTAGARLLFLIVEMSCFEVVMPAVSAISALILSGFILGGLLGRGLSARHPMPCSPYRAIRLYMD